MLKFLFVVLLILSVYIYATIDSSSRADINHSVAMIPQKIGETLESVANRVGQMGAEYHIGDK